MNVIKTIAFILLLAIALPSCLTMNKERCENADLKAMGQAEGREGRRPGFAEFRKNCEYWGVTVDRAEYERGYVAGITAYCTPENGKLVGLRGEDYQRQCPMSLEPRFLSGYNEGKISHDGLAVQKAAVAVKAKKETPQCRFDSDCNIKFRCSSDRCESNGKKCTFDSDCVVHGDCSFNKCANRP